MRVRVLCAVPRTRLGYKRSGGLEQPCLEVFALLLLQAPARFVRASLSKGWSAVPVVAKPRVLRTVDLVPVHAATSFRHIGEQVRVLESHALPNVGAHGAFNLAHEGGAAQPVKLVEGTLALGFVAARERTPPWLAL